MNDFEMEGLISPRDDTGRSRKRNRDVKSWDKTRRKFARNSASAHPDPHVNCNHGERSKVCKVRILSEEDIQGFHAKVYGYKSKVDQDNFILNYIMCKEPKRHRPRTNDPRPKLVAEYFVRTQNGRLIRVCAKSFSSITGIERFRLNGITKAFNTTGDVRVEKRGGSRTKPEITRSDHLLKIL